MESEILQCSPQTMSTLRLRRNIFKNRKYDDCGSANQSFVTIKLYGRLAATWASERMDLKDTEFIKRLLVIKKKYDNLLHTCKCKDGFQIAAKEFEHNEWFREENIANPDLNIESDDEERTIMNIEIDKCDPEIQASKDTGSCFDSSDSDYELNEDKDIDKFQPFCKLCNKAVKKGQKVKHSMSEHFILYVECKKCKEIDANDDDSTKDSDKDLIPLNEYFDHLITTHESVKCVFCKSNCMLKKDKLRDHFMKKHAKYILCRCLECDKGNGNTNSAVVKESLVKAHSVKGHLLSMHMPEGQGRFPCSICGLLMTAKSIARHMKNIHANKALDESNLCDICGKYFTYLKRHKKIHIPLTERLKNKNHQCTTCGKSFSNKYNLRVHSRLHTGEKPYVCDVCGKGFCQNVELRLHTHNHHNKIKTRSKKTKKKREPESETIESSLNGIVLQKVQLVESKVVAPISNETNQQTLAPHVLEIHPRDNDLSQVLPIYAVLTAEGLPTTHNDAILSGNENFLQNLDSSGASVTY